MDRTHDAAGVAIINEKNEVLLVHQTYGKKHWSLPGGVVENGESAWAAAIRECKEEIDIHINESDTDLTGVYFMSHRNGYIFTFKSRVYHGDIQVDRKEIDSFGFFSLDNLPRPITNFSVDRVRDAVNGCKTIFKEQHIKDYKTIE